MPITRIAIGTRNYPTDISRRVNDRAATHPAIKAGVDSKTRKRKSPGGVPFRENVFNFAS